MGAKGAPESITVKNEGTTKIVIEGLDDIEMKADVKADMKSDSKTDTRMTLSVPEPITMNNNGRTEFAITEPIVTRMSTDVALDMKPMVLDACLTVKLADLPKQHIRRPYEKSYALRVFGREIFDFRMCGESETIIDDVVKKPLVIWGSEKHRPYRTRSEHFTVGGHSDDCGHGYDDVAPGPAVAAEGDGLRIDFED